MDEHIQSSRAHLFTVRVWREDMGEGQWEWRGKVQHVGSGEAFYFREWQGLTARLKSWLQGESQYDYLSTKPPKITVISEAQGEK